MIEYRACKDCGEEKDIKFFYLRKSGRPRTECKKCFNKKQMERVRKNPEKRRAYFRDYCKKQYDADPQKFRDKAARIRAEDPDRTKRIQSKSRKKTYAEMPSDKKAKLHARNKNWASANRPRIREIAKGFRLRNMPKFAAKSRLRDASKIQATPKWITKQHIIDMEKIYEAAHNVSMESGEKYHVDHFYPLKGKTVCGLHVPWNLIVIPASINIAKGNKMPEEFFA